MSNQRAVQLTKKIGRGVFMTFILVMVLGSLSNAAETPLVISVGGINPVGSSEDIATKKFIEIATAKASGKLKFEYFPAGQTGNAQKQIESVLIGDQDIFLAPSVHWAPWFKDFNALSLAFIFRDRDHLTKFLGSSVNAAIKDRFLKQRGISVIVDNWIRVPNVVCSVKPIPDINSLKGLKMRVPEIEVYLRNWRALGCRPTVVAWGEAYLALKQGVVDAIDTPFHDIEGMKFHEVAPYISMTQHLITYTIIPMNDKKYQKLTPELKQVLAAAGREAGDLFSEMAKESITKGMGKLVKEGAKIVNIDNKPFRDPIAALADQLESEGMWPKGLYEQIQRIQ